MTDPRVLPSGGATGGLALSRARVPHEPQVPWRVPAAWRRRPRALGAARRAIAHVTGGRRARPRRG
ncbi:hypothetical protein [Jiangella anatolica]|uniref:hypothetical protein n=1 Tax=Jiangella anatolica TaxID=2670374 RepID=UPI0011B52DC0|nr:hypothetical protein [Jiangella anatolica]